MSFIQILIDTKRFKTAPNRNFFKNLVINTLWHAKKLNNLNIITDVYSWC